MLEILIEYFPWILLAVFGAFAYFVEDVRITSSVIVVTALINMAMGSIYEDGTTLSYLYKGVIDTTSAMTLLILYERTGAKKSVEQGVVFLLFAGSHGWLMYEVFATDYWFYDYYDRTMWGLTALHFLVMGDYYEELYKNIKNVLVGNVRRFGHSLRFNHWFGNWKHRVFNMDGRSGRVGNDDVSGSQYNNHGKKGKKFGSL